MKTIEPGSPLPIGAPPPPPTNVEDAMKPGPREQQLRDMREKNAEDGMTIPPFAKLTQAERDQAWKDHPPKGRAGSGPVGKGNHERKIKNPGNGTRDVMAIKPTTPEAKALAKEIDAAKAKKQKEKNAAKKEKREAERRSKTPTVPTGADVSTQADQPSAAADQQESAMRSTNTKTTKSKAKAAARTPVKAKTAKAATGKSKVELIAGLLQRKEGCTTADVLKATGWPAVSMPQQAKAAGLKLKKEKDGKVTRYYAA